MSYKDPSEHTTQIPILYERYVKAMANVYRPNLPEAEDCLKKIIKEASAAADLLVEMRGPSRASIDDVLSPSERAAAEAYLTAPAHVLKP